MSAPQVQSYTYRDGQLVSAMIQTGADARPLVVIDPEDGETVTRLTREIYKAAPLQGSPELYDAMQAALRSLIADPKPDEPQGLGAVVEDEKGDVWTRCRRPAAKGVLGVEWENERTCGHERWHAIAATRVLSEGWSE